MSEYSDDVELLPVVAHDCKSEDTTTSSLQIKRVDAVPCVAELQPKVAPVSTLPIAPSQVTSGKDDLKIWLSQNISEFKPALSVLDASFLQRNDIEWTPNLHVLEMSALQLKQAKNILFMQPQKINQMEHLLHNIKVPENTLNYKVYFFLKSLSQTRLFKLFQCQHPGCNYAEKCMSKFFNHVRIHTAEKPYKCDECPSSFAQQINLRMHKKTQHLKILAFKCNHCSK